jgi:hypothetical protein
VFLQLGPSCGDGRVTVTTVGELVSVLFGPCAGVGHVVLDALPDQFAKALTKLAGIERETFIASHLGMQRPPVVRVRAAHRAPPRPPERADGLTHEETNIDVKHINRSR